jgi:hypothetical protein
MQVVINISEKDYQTLKKKEEFDAMYLNYYEKLIVYGTPLPRGYGDLITKEQAIELVEFYQINPQHFDFVNLIDDIKDEKPIIEADKGE